MTTNLADLALLGKPVKMPNPDLGDLFFDIYGGFQDWLAEGLDIGRWADGDDLIRAVLVEQTKTGEVEDAPAPPAEAVLALGPAQLEAVAGAVLAMSSSILRPNWIQREGGGTRRRARRRREDETYDMAARDGETERDRLLRIARDWREDRRLRDRELMATALGSYHPALLEAARRANEVVGLAGASGLRDALKGMDFAGLSAAQKVFQGYDFAGLTAARKAFEGIDISGVLDMQRTFAGATSTMSIGAELTRLARVNRPAFDAVNQVLAEQARTIQSALAVTAGSEFIAAAQALTALTAPRSYFEELRKQLHVAIPAATLAAFAVAQASALPSAELREALANVSALRPGFQMTAALGLTGMAPRGVVADVLQFYEVELNPATPVFAAAVQTAHVADGTEAVPDEQIAHLWATIQDLQARARQEKEPVRRLGLTEIIGLIALLVGLLALYGDYQGRVADQADREERAAFEQEMRRARADARTEAADRYRTTRYVSTDGPLRTEPHARAQVLQMVYSGQLAVAKDQRDGWVLVEVFSYASEHSVSGWLPARRLRAGR